MNLTHLHYFVTLADEGHFANTAKSLFIARSTLSLAISQLERELGAPLFEKNGSNFTLTVYGREFYRYASLALQNVEIGKRNVAAMVQGDSRNLRLGVPFTMQNEDWAHLVRGFRNSTDTPGHIEITQGFSGELLHELSVGNLDITFAGKNADAPKGLIFTPYWSHELVVVVNKDNPLAARDSITLEELASFHITSYKQGCPPYDEIKIIADEYHLDLDCAYRDEITICCVVAADETAVAFATYSFLMKAFPDVKCLYIEGLQRDFHEEYLVYREDEPPTGIAKRFVEYASEHPMPKGYLPR